MAAIAYTGNIHGKTFMAAIEDYAKTLMAAIKAHAITFMAAIAYAGKQ